MPRVKMGYEEAPRRADAKLTEQLVDELNSDRKSGQPFIYEQEFSTGKIRVLVVWDAWKDLSLEKRTSTILAAIEQADGKEYRSRVTLASGLTVPEATAAGMLPFQIIIARRESDSVTFQECRNAVFAEGASPLFGPKTLQLRFPTEESAMACKARLIQQLPNSEDI